MKRLISYCGLYEEKKERKDQRMGCISTLQKEMSSS